MARREPRGGARTAGGALTRAAAALQNGLEIARFGGLGERVASPHEVVVDERVFRLRHYFPDSPERGVGRRPAALLVPPLMLTAEVWDVSPEMSAVAALEKSGIDPWVIDFGSPEDEPGGMERTLADHVVAVSEALGRVRESAGRDVHLLGYSQGGMFCYQAAAYLRSEGVASLVTFGSPVDLLRGPLAAIPEELTITGVEGLVRLASALLPAGLPAWMTRTGFRLMDPVKNVQQRIEFLGQLYDREALQRREGMRRFLGGEGWVAFPGPAFRDFLQQLLAQSRLMRGGLVIAQRPVTLADLACPILTFIGDADTLAPAPTIRALHEAAPRATVYEAMLPAGHFGLVVGSRAMQVTWPTVAAWLAWCEGSGPLPERARPLEDAAENVTREPTPFDRIREGLELGWHVGRDLANDTAGFVADRVGAFGRLSGVVAGQLGRLDRLAAIRGQTRVGMGLLLAEKAERSPDDTCFLFEGRAFTYAEANRRVDAVVRGLIACGVRQGDHVGVLMGTRPTALSVAFALSRLGAIAVLLRPDLSLTGQLRLAEVDHLIADPEHAEAARDAFARRPVLVLGGGGGPRVLASDLVDMEAIDPDRVVAPDWYTPNPGVAGEVALILFAGEGERPRANRITGRRWATAGFGTATACALTARDTVYCCAPLHHAAGLLGCAAGALVAGARLAMAPRFDPEIFWDEVRRYGVNVVFYAGALCRALVNAKPSPAERHHPIRLFAGSGMPRGIWQRLIERFAPAKVVEFYASTEGNAVLVNLSGEKSGSLGRPLPGSAELALAAWDLREGRRLEARTGLTRRTPGRGTGLLLSRVESERGEASGRPLRGVFEPGDAWASTGDLFHRDADGDYWLVDRASDVIQTRNCALPTGPIEDALATGVELVDLAVVYGVSPPGCAFEVPAAAITLRSGQKLDPRALRDAVDRNVDEPSRPLVIRVLDDLPMTAGHRPRKDVLRREGLGLEAGSGETLWRDPEADAYVPLDRDGVVRLVAMVAGSGEVSRNAE